MEPASQAELASILAEDLPSEHRRQIDRAVAFRRSLEREEDDGVWVGSEAELTSALVHTRTLVEFYRPVLGRKLISDRVVWWVSPFPDGELPAASAWGRAMGDAWDRLEGWRPAITSRLGPIGRARRHQDRPAWTDAKGQDFDVIGMVEAATSILGAYADFLQADANIDTPALAAVADAARTVRDHWTAERSRLPDDDASAAG